MNFCLECLRCLLLCHWCDFVLCNDCDVLWGDCHNDIDLVIILISVESYILVTFSLLSLLLYLSYHIIIFLVLSFIYRLYLSYLCHLCLDHIYLSLSVGYIIALAL
jgi:hypothetical protein